MEQETKNASHEEKLKAIIEKAKHRGLNTDYFMPAYSRDAANLDTFLIQHIDNIIFSHDFAKAFWGYSAVADFETGEVYRHKAFEEDGGETPIWKWQIQKLALTPPEERIDYLYRFIE